MKLALILSLSVSAAFGYDPPQHKLVYRETGRLGGWPANYGIWSWGDEILVGFGAAWHKTRPEDRHQQDPDKPEEPRLARSLDGGETWSVETSRDLLPPAQGGREPQDLKQPIDFARPGFAMTLRFLNNHTGPSLLWYTYDKGKNWSGPFRFPQFGNGTAARTDYIVNGQHDAMVFLTQGKSNHREGRTLCARTSDGGVTWNFAGYIGDEPAGFAIMPSTVRLSARELLSTVRVHDGSANRIDAYRSNDDGATWKLEGALAETGDFNGNPPMLLKLRDGRLCLTYGYRAEPYSIRARLSSDNGRTWSEVATIRDGGVAWDLGYVRSVQRRDGKIVTIYYFNDGPHNERFIEATIWSPAAGALDLSNATVVAGPSDQIAATVLVEELERRSGIRLKTSATLPAGKTAIAIASNQSMPGLGRAIPSGEKRAEGYRLFVDRDVVWVLGADLRGSLFGVGNLLRRVDASPGKLTLPGTLDIATAPAYSIRGHQLGYRPQANSYDAWSVAQFDRYIRELTFFGVNSIEGIPFQDTRTTPVMKVPRREMNRAIGEICKRYGLDYWVWIPADFDLNDKALRAAFLGRCDEFFKDTPELTGIFFPGGDPGKNSPELVFPFLEAMAARLHPVHPHAKMWVSLQQFSKAQVDYSYSYIDREKPQWLAGLVCGPSSQPIPDSRRRLAPQYQLRSYPDITHNKISQYEVPSWDQAFALTLGREAINPRPAEMALIHNRVAPYTNGFISYSDGIHDDINKTIWSALSWDPTQNVRDILIEYARAYFDSSVAEETADAILGLERNWRGPAIDNGAIEGTLLAWQQLEKRAPRLEENWRWQMCLLRANYDAYIRRRLIHETKLESEANAILANAPALGADHAMNQALGALSSVGVSPDLRSRIFDLCEKLFRSIGLQTSVEKYYASGEERGAVLDFVDYPLNNRWWLEDQFKLIRGFPSEAQKIERLHALATWEHPGPGSFYDNVGNLSKSPHVVRDSPSTAEETAKHEEPMFWWWEEGKSRARLTWQTTMWPLAMVYEALDPSARYVVRTGGYGQSNLRINGERVQPVVDGKQMGEFKEFPVAPKFLKDRKLVLTWDRPTDERELNWRQRSRLAEVWLLKKGEQP